MWSFIKKIVLFPLDLIYLTVDLFVICGLWLYWRLIKRTSMQPCRFLKGEQLDDQPAVVRSALRYKNTWMVRMIAPHIRISSVEGRKLPVTKEEEPYARYPFYDFVILLAVVGFWGVLLQVGLNAVTPKDDFGNPIEGASPLSFFMPDRGKTENLRASGDQETRHNPTRAAKYYNRAMKQIAREEYKQALVNLRIAQDANNLDPNILYELGMVWGALGQFVKSKEVLEAALERDANHTKSLLALSELYRRKNDLPYARKLAELALASDVNSVDALQANAVIAALEGNLEQAKAQAEQVVAKDPTDVKRLVAMGRLIGGMVGDLERGMILLDQALAQNPQHAETLVEKTRLYYRKSEFAKGDDALAHVLEIAPENVDANRLDAEMMLRRYGLNVGLTQYEKLMSRFANDDGVRLRYAELLLLSGKTSKGIARCKELTRSRIPSVSRTANWLLANTYFRSGMFEDAERYIDRVLDDSPNARSALLLKARTQVALDEGWDARASLRKILVNNPKDPEAVATLADTLVQSDRVEEALEELNTFLQKYPDEDAVRLMRTSVLMRMDRWDEAFVEIDALHGKYPDHPVLTNNLAFQLARSNEQIERAYALITPIYQKQGSNPNVADTYAFILARRGEHEAARPVYEQALRTQGGAGNPSIRFSYAQTLAELGMRDEAMRQAKICLKIDPDFAEAEDASVFLNDLAVQSTEQANAGSTGVSQ